MYVKVEGYFLLCVYIQFSRPLLFETVLSLSYIGSFVKDELTVDSGLELAGGRGELALYLATYLIDRTRDLGGLFLQEWGYFSPKMRDIPSKQQYGHSVIQVACRMNMYFL